MHDDAAFQRLAPGPHGAEEEELLEGGRGLDEAKAFPLLVPVGHQVGPQVQPDFEEQPGLVGRSNGVKGVTWLVCVLCSQTATQAHN
jgi:hypothetical protein